MSEQTAHLPVDKYEELRAKAEKLQAAEKLLEEAKGIVKELDEDTHLEFGYRHPSCVSWLKSYEEWKNDDS